MKNIRLRIEIASLLLTIAAMGLTATAAYFIACFIARFFEVIK